MMLRFDEGLRQVIDECVWSPVALDEGAAIEPSSAMWRTGAALILAVAAERTRGLLSIISERANQGMRRLICWLLGHKWRYIGNTMGHCYQCKRCGDDTWISMYE